MKRFIQKEQESQALNQQLIRSTQLLDELKTKRQDQEEEIAGLRAKVKAYDEKQLVIHQEMEQFNAVKKIDEIVLMRKQLVCLQSYVRTVHVYMKGVNAVHGEYLCIHF